LTNDLRKMVVGQLGCAERNPCPSGTYWIAPFKSTMNLNIGCFRKQWC